MAAFKSEKEFEKWLASTPSAAKRLRRDEPSPSVVPLATAQTTSVVVRLPTRSAPRDHYVTFATKFDRAMAWLFVGVTGLGTLGIVATTSAILALEYIR